MINNKKKLIALALCSSTLLVGCNKNLQEISKDDANSFCLKNYKSIIKVCSSVNTDYNLSFNYDESKLENIKIYLSNLIKWVSVYDDDNLPEDMITIDTENKIVSINKNDVHINESITEAKSFLIPSLGMKYSDGETTNSYIKYYLNFYPSNDTKIYVSQANNIVIKGSLSTSGANDNEGAYLFPHVEEYFDSDGCTSKIVMNLKKGEKIVNAQGHILCTVANDSSMTATYSYF